MSILEFNGVNWTSELSEALLYSGEMPHIKKLQLIPINTVNNIFSNFAGSSALKLFQKLKELTIPLNANTFENVQNILEVCPNLNKQDSCLNVTNYEKNLKYLEYLWQANKLEIN